MRLLVRARIFGSNDPITIDHLTVAHLQAAAAMDWLEMADLMDARTSRTQDYSFSRYAPVAAAGIHFLCRTDQRAAVVQPKKVSWQHIGCSSGGEGWEKGGLELMGEACLTPCA